MYISTFLTLSLVPMQLNWFARALSSLVNETRRTLAFSCRIFDWLIDSSAGSDCFHTLAHLVNIMRADRRLSSRLVRHIEFSELFPIKLLSRWSASFVSVGARDTSTSLALTRSCTYKYFTFTCRFLLDKPCLCASAPAALPSHRSLILDRMPRSLRIAFTCSRSAHPAPSA